MYGLKNDIHVWTDVSTIYDTCIDLAFGGDKNQIWRLMLNKIPSCTSEAQVIWGNLLRGAAA